MDRAIQAIKNCLDEGFDLQYHIVGDGDQENFLKELVVSLGVSDKVFFYGNQSNPYPYIKKADLFLLPSYHEAAPMVFDEAACLGVPVLAAETTSAAEMITQKGAGFVCENSQDGITKALLALLKFPGRLTEVREGLKTRLFTNDANRQAFDGLITALLPE